MTVPADFAMLVGSFVIDLTNEGLARKTVTMYADAARDLGAWLDTLGDEPVRDESGAVVVPAAVALTEEVTKAHMSAYIGHLRARGNRYTDGRAGRPLAPATLNNIYRSLQAFWKWAAAEEHIEVNPMATLRSPKAGKSPVPVFPELTYRALLDTCGKGRGRAYRDIRDEAILRVLMATGCRCSEILVDLEDLRLHHGVMRVTGKKGKVRDAHFGPRTAKAIDVYQYARAKQPHAARTTALWLGERGPMSASGIYQVVVRRGGMLGMKLHPHMFRHTFAHEFRAQGGSETDLMNIMGWDSPEMARRYGASAADDRAAASQARIGIGERF